MIRACALMDLPPGEAVRIVGPHAPIAIFNAGGAIYAIDDTCSHQDASLSEGWLEGCFVECPLHAASFDLRTGEATCLPAKRPVKTHSVHVNDGEVYVEVEVNKDVA